MSHPDYKWKRFWCPRSSQINLGDRGYLTDPESEYGKCANPELVGLEAIVDVPCLVLLGEPGIGKSQELVNLKCYTENNLDSVHKVLKLNLRSCTNLKEDLFKDEQFIAWENGTHRLYLFLDSLDEGLLQIQTLATQLVDTFTKDRYRDKLSRLYLRIACRTAVFPNILEEGLKELWQESNVGIYELAPLRRIDVQASVTANGLDANTFLNEVDRKGVVPFAIKPITLRFLLNVFQKNNGQFSPDQKLIDLYLDGCSLLCEEQNQSRRGSRQIGNLDVAQRLIVAARIAAVTIFANRFAVWTEPNSGNIPKEDVLLEELCLGDEITNGRRFQVTRDVIEEVLDTGLFSSRGSGRIGWAHQTYAEFLAAWYLTQHNLELSQVLNLIIHPDQRVVPQLQETAAWLASMIPKVFQGIIKTDPDILLQSDIATASDIDKASLVESLLQAYDEDKLPYAPFRFWQYEHLSYAGLPNQLRKYIINSSKNTSSRLTAINIAKARKVNAVQKSLVDVALNSQDNYQVRVHAISAISNFCEEDTKTRLKPLVIDNIEYDPDDDLKGYALQALYPTQISAEEVLQSLKSPNRQIFGGSYQRFLAEIFAKHLQPNNLLVALRWVEEQPNRRDLHYPFDKLSDSILLKAWEYIEDLTILPAFARVVLLRMEKHSAIIQSDYSEFKQQISKNDNKRRQLIDAVISMMSDSEQITWVSLCDSQYSQLTLQKSDFLWLFEKLEAASEKHIQEIYANLICQEFIQTGWNDADLASAIIEFGSYNSVLREKFPSELAPPIELDSQRAKEEKARYEESQRFLANLSQRNPIPLLEPSPKQRVISVLEKIETEEPELWWQLPVEMSLEPTSSHYHFCDKPDLTKFPGWIEAEVDTRKRIIETSKVYLEVRQPGTQKPLNTSNYSGDEFAGSQALYLLLKQEPEFILKISSQIWTEWIPTILKYTDLCIRNINQDKYCECILKKAYEINSNKVIDTLIDFMHLNNYQPSTYHDHDIYRSAKDLIGQPLAKSILSKVNIEDLNPGMLEILLKDLFVDANDEAKMLALSFIRLPLSTSEKARGRALVSARVLLDHVDNFIWPAIWAAIEQDSSFGREVLEYIGRMVLYDEPTRKLFQALDEKYLADLFIFLMEQYPEIEIDRADTTDNKNKLVGVSWQISNSNDEVRDWKRYIPQWLQERGTSEACEALRKIIRVLPELANDLQWRLLETEAFARRNTWNPPRPEDILQLVASQEPSNSRLSKQLDKIDRRTQKMADEPKVDQSIHIKDSKINGVVNTGNGKIENKIDFFKLKKGIDWKFWLSISVTVMVALISVFASGVFNDEIKKFFKQNLSPQVEQKIEK